MFFENSLPKANFGQNIRDSPNGSLTADSRSLQTATLKGCIPLSKREVKIIKKMRPECLFSTSLLYKILPTNLVPCKLAFFYFLYILSEMHSTMRLFFNTDIAQILLFFALFKPILLQFFTLLQHKKYCTLSIFRAMEARAFVVQLLTV